MENNPFHSEALREYARSLLSAGFCVVAPAPSQHLPRGSSYFSFEKDGEIGYVQEERGQFKFCTVHKPNMRVGTGFMFAETFEPSVRIAEECAACLAPNWAISDALHVVKYKDLAEFQKSKTGDPRVFSLGIKSPVVTHEEGNPEAWHCICGNEPQDHGFYPCMDDGTDCEPVEGWTGKYKCAQCKHVFHPDDVKEIIVADLPF